MKNNSEYPLNENNSYSCKLRKNQLLDRLELMIKMLNFVCRRKVTTKSELKKVQLDSTKMQNTLQTNLSLTIKDLEDMVETCENYLNKYS